MRKTSNGNLTMNWPFNENITTIVNRSAINVMGLILVMNLVSYHSSPLAFRRK